MIKIILILLALSLFLAVSAFAEEGTDFLGKPFPDFTVTDVDGNMFTLSEALNGHEAVVINFWATYCPPCIAEFPEVNAVYEEYKDKVAFIALSTYTADTDDVIKDFRQEHNLTLLMGQDKEQLFIHTHSEGIPTTVIVDRFGNAVFCQIGAFNSGDDLKRTLDTFLGDQYTETVVQHRIPKDTSTLAIPVSSARAIRFDHPNVIKASILLDGSEGSFDVCTVNERVVHLQIEVTEADVLSNVIFYNSVSGGTPLKDLYDPERGILSCEIEIPEDTGYVDVALLNNDTFYYGADDPDLIVYYLVPSVDGIASFQELLTQYGYAVVGIEYQDSEETPAAVSADAYIIHVADQDGNPVPEVIVNFCTDTACVPVTADANGTVTFTGTPDVYHVQVIDLPDGYSSDESFEMYTPKAYGEWTLRIRKD